MLGRPKNRRKHNGKTRARWRLPLPDLRRWGASAASLAAMGAVIALLVWALDQPIETVSASGRFQRVSPVDVERAVKAQVRGAGLVSVDLDAVREAIEALPWVDSATVQRAWPRGLHVTVIEQVAAARWGKNGLLNVRGELFASDARHIPQELPQLSGPEGTERLVAERYLAAQSRLAGSGLRLTALRLDARGAWELDLSNGVTVRLGRKEVDERFERFASSAAKLVAQRAQDIVYVDMRYTNGFAVGWRSASSKRPQEDERDV